MIPEVFCDRIQRDFRLRIQQLEFGNSSEARWFELCLASMSSQFVSCLLIKTKVRLTSGTEADHTILVSPEYLRSTTMKRQFKIGFETADNVV